MRKLIIPPDNSSYVTTDSEKSVVRTELAGGAGRYRRDLLNATSTVEVVWNTNQQGFVYLRAFFRGVTVNGALPFEIDLILDDCELTTHTAYFMPGTFKLAAQAGLAFSCTATLEVVPLPFTISDMSNIVDVYNEFGGDWMNDAAMFDNLVNGTIPTDDL